LQFVLRSRVRKILKSKKEESAFFDFCFRELTMDENCFVASPVLSLIGLVQMFVTGEEVRSGADPRFIRLRLRLWLPDVEGKLPPL
jgi:hypothetical protein